MENKNKIFWWWRRRKRPAISLNTSDKEKDTDNNFISNNNENKELEKEPKNKEIISPIVEPQPKELDKKLPQKENERDTLIKPKPISLENTIEIKKQELDLEEEKEEINDKNFINEELQPDIAIRTNTLDEIEKMLRSNYQEIQNIKYELEILEQQEQDEVITEQVEKLIQELEQLIKKFEEIKKNFYKNNFDELYKHSNNDGYIGKLIEEYKTSLTNNAANESTLVQIKQIEEYITLINEIIEIETQKDELNDKLNNKKEKFEERDKEFEELNDKYTDVKKINEQIESFNNKCETTIKEIESKVSEAANISKKVEYKSELAVNYARLLTSTLLIGLSTKIPFNRGGNLLKMGLMMAGVAGLASSIRVRTKETNTITKISFIDYEKDILSKITNVHDMNLMLDKTLVDIKDIRDELQKEFGEYINQIPEYYELLVNLDSIEKELLVKQEFIIEQNKKLEQTLEQNNAKVKRLEEENFE